MFFVSYFLFYKFSKIYIIFILVINFNLFFFLINLVNILECFLLFQCFFINNSLDIVYVQLLTHTNTHSHIHLISYYNTHPHIQLLTYTQSRIQILTHLSLNMLGFECAHLLIQHLTDIKFNFSLLFVCLLPSANLSISSLYLPHSLFMISNSIF